jgi:predicted tellurium resistance membrane protein TerC
MTNVLTKEFSEKQERRVRFWASLLLASVVPAAMNIVVLTWYLRGWQVEQESADVAHDLRDVQLAARDERLAVSLDKLAMDVVPRPEYTTETRNLREADERMEKKMDMIYELLLDIQREVGR